MRTSSKFILEIRYKGFLLGFVEYKEDTALDNMKLFFTIKETAFSDLARFEISASNLCFYYENVILKDICELLNRYVDHGKMLIILG